MRNIPLFGSVVLTLAVGWFGHAAFADEEPEKKADPMEEMFGIHKPGAKQAMLCQLAGEWDVSVKMFGQGGKVMESKASAVNKVLFGGRYLHQTYKGSFGGQPFEGISLMAHDNAKKVFQSMWIDSMSSGIYKAESAAGTEGSTVTFRGTWEGKGGAVPSKDVLKIVSKDHFVFEGWVDGPDGPVQNVELTYKRRVAPAKGTAR